MRQPQLADQRRQLLLHPVVDVAFDAPALLVLGLDDACPGGGDLGGLVLDLAQARLELVRLAHRPQAERGLATERAEQLAVVGVERAAALRPALEESQLLAALDQREAGGAGPASRRWPTPAVATTGTTPMVDARAQRSRSARRAVATSSSRTSDRPACSAAAPNVSISRASLPTSPNSHRSAARSNRSRTGKKQRGDRQHRRRRRRARHDLRRSWRRRRTRRARRPRRGWTRGRRRPPPSARRWPASPSSGWTIVAAAPAATAAQATARGRAARKPSPTSTRPSRRTSCITATTPTPVTQAQRQPAQLPPLVDARRRAASTRAARRRRGDRAPGRAAPPRRAASKKVSDGTCSGDTAGSSRGSALGSPAMPNANAVTTPASDGERADVARQPPAAAACRRCPTASTTAATSRPAPSAPRSGRSTDGVGDVHRLADDRGHRDGRGHAEHEEPAAAAAAPGGGDQTGDDDRDEADEHPQPGAGGAVGPRVAAGRSVAPRRRAPWRRRRTATATTASSRSAAGAPASPAIIIPAAGRRGPPC